MHSRSGRHGRGNQVCSTAGALAPFEVAVAGGGTALARLQAVSVHGQAHRAAGLAPLEAGGLEDFVQTLSLSLGFHKTRTWHDHRQLHVLGHFLAELLPPMDLVVDEKQQGLAHRGQLGEGSEVAGGADRFAPAQPDLQVDLQQLQQIGPVVDSLGGQVVLQTRVAPGAQRALVGIQLGSEIFRYLEIGGIGHGGDPLLPGVTNSSFICLRPASCKDYFVVTGIFPQRKIMTMIIEPYSDQLKIWPNQGKHILAQFDDETVILYQCPLNELRSSRVH